MKEARPKPFGIRNKTSHENTPPPISIDDGSLSIGVRLPPTQVVPAGHLPLDETHPGKWQYQGNLNDRQKNAIEHIKVLHGSGMMIYTDLQAEGSIITIQLNDGGTVVDNLEFREVPPPTGTQTLFQVTSSHRMNYAAPGLSGGKHRWAHAGAGGARDFYVSAIQIIKNGQIQLNLTGMIQEDFRILVWLTEP